MNSLTVLSSNVELPKNIVFTIGEHKYALPLMNVLEIMELPKLEHPQKLSSNIVGLLNFNNILVSVLDVRFYLGIELEQYSINSKLILAKTDETMFGIVADKIDDIAVFDNYVAERYSVNDNKNQITDYICTYDENTVSVLNAYSLEKIVKNEIQYNDVEFKNLFPKDEKSAEIFEKRAVSLHERLNNLTVNNVFSDNKFVSFLLNKTTYCMNLKYAKEFVHGVNMISLPCSPDYIEGLITVRGDFVTVLNLKKFLNYSYTEYSSKRKVILINSDVLKLGLLVDDIYEITDILDEKIVAREMIHDNSPITEEFIDNNSVKPILNIEKLLRDERLYIEEN